MKILLLNASPKRRGGNSAYFAQLMRLRLCGHSVRQMKLRGPKSYGEFYAVAPGIDALVIALPVYVDALPASLLRFLLEAEGFCRAQGLRFRVYAIANCGFFEGRQCRHALGVLRCFCTRAGLRYGGGIGIGAGEMLGALRAVFIVALLVALVLQGWSALQLSLAGASAADVLQSVQWFALLRPCIVYAAFGFGLLRATWLLGRNIVKDRARADRFTGVTLCPRFLFVLLASAFWFVRAAAKGTPPWRLWDKAAEE